MTYHWKEIAVSGVLNIKPGEDELFEMYKRKRAQEMESLKACFTEDLYSTGAGENPYL